MMNQTDIGFLKGNALYQISEQLSEQYLEIDPKLVRTAFALIDFISSSLTTFETYLERHGLSQGRLLILMLLLKGTEQIWTPTKLADTLSVTRATVTGLLNVLEKDNWIERLPYSKDGRMKVVILTEIGRTKVTEFIPEHLERMSKMWANFSDEELGLLLILLEKVKSAIPSLLTPADVGNEVTS
jgi:DNA-binding MarR family transcriptional regulator